jgi:RNA polymerase sigma factor (sigma-70 family)
MWRNDDREGGSMRGGGLRDLIGRLRQVVGPSEARTSDSELLRRWATGRDETAFEVLVWRHGRLVLGVCRRLLRAEQDVEDAFQVTFLALARKSASVSGQAAGPWLYTVARRAALRIRASARAETIDPQLIDQVSAAHVQPAGAAEFWEAFDDALAGLPAKYREPFVLCHLEGRSTEEAARELGRPVGTIHSRLARARSLLRDRLARRGLVVGTELPNPAVETAPPGRLVSGAVGVAVNGGTAAVEAITKEVLQAMFLTRLSGLAVPLAVAVFGAGAGLLGYETVSARTAHNASEPARQAGREEAAPPSRQLDATAKKNEEKDVNPEPKRKPKKKAGSPDMNAPAFPGGGAPRGGGGRGGPPPQAPGKGGPNAGGGGLPPPKN